MRIGRTRVGLLASIAAVGMALAACSSPATSSSPSGGTAPGQGATKVGIIAVGPKDDYGYNQAVFQGAQAIRKAYPNVEVIDAYSIPENDSAATTMEQMISDGATIIFATSYGHLQTALKVAKAHPDVVVVHQGGLIPTPIPANVGSYFGAVYEPVYLGGILAGAATTSDKLGYVYAIPIPQTLANINAFELGAQSVTPQSQTIAVSTPSQTNPWCDPPVQADKIAALLSQGVDVVTQHQDCTKTIIQATENAGKYTVGYHADASSLAPKGWLGGSEWNWGPLYVDIVKTAIDGKFTGSTYNANYRANMASGKNPFISSAYGPSVTAQTKALVDAATAKLKSGWTPFTGPLYKQDGTLIVPAGTSLTVDQIETMDYFVKGVVGTTK
ncbi:MAG: BMP family ABC transporter substrate-binding protein [Actinomycetota bacterium]|nr:MAG: BMP family ABC transporter substrate-binding protein [Actinomycetota bacterium]